MSYRKFQKMGLKKSRYEQMMLKFGNNESSISDVIEDWGIENVNRGYEIFDFDGTGMLEVEEIGEISVFECDDEKAARQAEADGIRIIPVDELPASFDRKYFGWIDTSENRRAIEEYCRKAN
jgi:hypothetical protein